MEVKREDVIKVILQFLQDNGLTKTQQCLQEESNVTLNLVDSKQKLQQDIQQGKWDQVLQQIKLFRLTPDSLMNLYELIIEELVELNETQTAHQFFIEMIVPNCQEFKERLLRLDYLIRKPGKLDYNEIYTDNLTKEDRRKQIANQLIEQIVEAPPCRLLELIGDSLKYLQSTQIQTSKYNLLFGNEKEDYQEVQLSTIEKVIKYSEKMRVNCSVYTPDNQCLITGSIDGVIEVWDPERMTLRTDLDYQNKEEFMMHDKGIISLNATNELLASLDQNSKIKIWKLKPGKCFKIIENSHVKQITQILFGKDSQQLFLASDIISLYGLKNSMTLKNFKGHEGLVTSMFISTEGSRLYTSSLDQTLRVWDVHTGEQAHIYKYTTAIEKIFNINGQILICPRDKQLILLNQTYQEVRKYQTDSELIGCVATNNFIYALSSSHLYSFELYSGKGLKSIKLPCLDLQDIIIGEKQLFINSYSGLVIFIK